MTLREKQSAFALAYAKLIIHAFDLGYALTLADSAIDPIRKYRDAETKKVRTGHDAVHIAKSLHYLRLAADLNLFVDGQFVADGGHPVWTVLGTYFESLHPLARWGGRFNDANHVSFEHEGRK